MLTKGHLSGCDIPSPKPPAAHARKTSNTVPKGGCHFRTSACESEPAIAHCLCVLKGCVLRQGIDVVLESTAVSQRSPHPIC